jgi:protein-S-isoprenylcysteine O-methyltransferase Ste14
MAEQDGASGGIRPERKLARAEVAMLLVSVVVFPTWLVGPFVAAGTAGWPAGWAYFGALAAVLIAHRLYVARGNPELLRRRQRLGTGTERWDLIWSFLFWPLMALVPIVAGAGVRCGAAVMPPWLWPVGLLLLAFGMAVSARAMVVNPHFEGTVRIQRERDHRVIDVGPYRSVRHPGNVGLSLWALASPFLLRSWVAFGPAAVVVGWLVLRTTLEDALLQRELDGYREYAARVRFRLIPGIW